MKICLICNREFVYLGALHLRVHGITPNEYDIKFKTKPCDRMSDGMWSYRSKINSSPKIGSYETSTSCVRCHKEFSGHLGFNIHWSRAHGRTRYINPEPSLSGNTLEGAETSSVLRFELGVSPSAEELKKFLNDDNMIVQEVAELYAVDSNRMSYHMGFVGVKTPTPPFGRRTLTRAHKLLTWALTKSKVIGWENEYPLIGYSIDIAFPEYHLAVEVDGWTHFDIDTGSRRSCDFERDLNILKVGWVTVRFTDDEVLSDYFGIVSKIQDKLRTLNHERGTSLRRDDDIVQSSVKAESENKEFPVGPLF